MSNTPTDLDARWHVSASPHLRDNETTPRIMWSVVAALLPAGAWSIYLFGVSALYVILLSVITAITTEIIVQRMRHRPDTIHDGSAVVTGLLLAYVLPSHRIVTQTMASGEKILSLAFLPWYIPVIGAVVAIGIAKHAFGGLGYNIWNPALVGRAFVHIAFIGDMSPSAWPWPNGGIDATTKATVLSKTGQVVYTVKELFFGFCPGSLGEVSALLLILGGVFLIARRYVDWRLPLGYLAGLLVLVTLLTWSPRIGIPPWAAEFGRQFQAFRSGELVFGGWFSFAARHIFSGGVIIGAFFMATDMVTSPLSHKGQLVFGIGCGLLTALIRSYASYPEGVCYAILLMNTVRPYVDKFTRPRVLGEGKA